MWVPLYSELKDNPKLITLCDQLDINEAEGIGYLVYLWWFTGTYAEDGNLSKFSATHIERYCQWRGEKRKLFTAFVEARFIEKVKDGIQIKDWQEHTGKFIEKSKKQRDRMRSYREKSEEQEVSDNSEIKVSEQKNNVNEQLDNSYITVNEQLDNSYITVNEQLDNCERYVRCNHTNQPVPTVPIIDDVVITRTREGEISEKEEKSAVEEIANHLFFVTGRTASAADYISITETLNSPDAPSNLSSRLNLIKSTMAAVARQKNKDPVNNKISSFSYFQKPILSEFLKKKTIKTIQERGIKLNGAGEKDNRHQSPTGGLKDLIPLDDE